MRHNIRTVVWETTTEQLETLKAAKFCGVFGFAKSHFCTCLKRLYAALSLMGGGKKKHETDCGFFHTRFSPLVAVGKYLL